MMVDYMPFLNELRDKVSNTYHGKIIYVTVSGSDLYGFRSKDSDTDFRGCFQIMTQKLFGLNNFKETIEYETRRDGVVENEAVLHELKKEVNLMLKGNCNIYEHIFAEPLETSQEHRELQDLTYEYWNSKGLYNSYRGMAYQNYNKFILGGKHSAKKYLYVLRALMAGTYALAEHVVEPNLKKLNEFFEEPIVDELLDLKKRGLEKDPVKHMYKYDELCDKYFKVIDKQFLENQDVDPPNLDEANEWLKQLRIDYLD